MRKKDSLFVGFDYYSDDELALCVMRKDNKTNNNISLLSIFKGKEALKLYKQLIGEEINNEIEKENENE